MIEILKGILIIAIIVFLGCISWIMCLLKEEWNNDKRRYRKRNK